MRTKEKASPGGPFRRGVLERMPEIGRGGGGAGGPGKEEDGRRRSGGLCKRGFPSLGRKTRAPGRAALRPGRHETKRGGRGPAADEGDEAQYSQFGDPGGKKERWCVLMGGGTPMGFTFD